MASVLIDAIWINLAADPSTAIYLPYGTGLQSQPSVAIATGGYAGGNIRKTRQKGYQAQLTASVQAVTYAERQLLEFDADNGGWLGEMVCIRDHRGRKFYGLFTVQISEHDYNDECDVSLTLTQISYSEAV